MKLELTRNEIPPHLMQFFKCVDHKSKDEIDIPNMVCEALRRDGWYRRSTIIWSKPNPMPESVTDRPTKAHEYIFLLSKSARYYYDAGAISEQSVGGDKGAGNRNYRFAVEGSQRKHEGQRILETRETRNRRTVWEVATQPCAEAHFATFPPKLIEPCILAGSRPGDTILDPFMGAGTTALVSKRLGRFAVGAELNAEYIDIAARRLGQPALLGPDDFAAPRQLAITDTP